MSFTAALITRRLLDGWRWSVEQMFFYGVGSKESYIFAMVFKGFITDLTSVPRVLHWLIPKTGKHDQAAVVHDLGFRYNCVCIYRPKRMIYELVEKDQKYWDKVFLEAMEVLGVGYIRRNTLYRTLRLVGFKVWNEYREANEKHPLLELYPTGIIPDTEWNKALKEVEDRYGNRNRS